MSNAPDINSIQRTISNEIETLLSLEAGSIGPDTDLTNLGIDSLRFVSLLLVIEERFGVNLMQTGLKSDDTQSSRKLAGAVVAGRQA